MDTNKKPKKYSSLNALQKHTSQAKLDFPKNRSKNASPHDTIQRSTQFEGDDNDSPEDHLSVDKHQSDNASVKVFFHL